MEQPSSLFDKIRERAGKRVADRPTSIFGPLPPEQWPSWAKEMKALSVSTDKGIGDVVARVIGDETSEAFKAWLKTTLGKHCAGGCIARLNSAYPLP